MSEYVFGSDSKELVRLRMQQAVWGPVTDAFLDKLSPAPGGRYLDAGCGPGFVIPSLLRLGGAGTQVVALDASERMIRFVEGSIAARRWSGVTAVCSPIETAVLAPSSFDLIFARWLFSFVPTPGATMQHLARALRPGGILALQDYVRHGNSLFPESAGFQRVLRATNELYAMEGGDLSIAARFPELFEVAGLQRLHYEPVVLGGTPESAPFRWADGFFPTHTESMVERGLLSRPERERFLKEWEDRKNNPDAVFFSPIVVNAAARKPG